MQDAAPSEPVGLINPLGNALPGCVFNSRGRMTLGLYLKRSVSIVLSLRFAVVWKAEYWFHRLRGIDCSLVGEVKMPKTMAFMPTYREPVRAATRISRAI